MVLCECGCGETVKVGNRFIHGHQSRGKNNPFYGKQHTAKTKTKISTAAITRWQDSEYRKNHSGKNSYMFRKPSPMRGKKHSAETKRKMSESGKIKVFSIEHRKNMGKATKARWQDPEFRKKMSDAHKGEKSYWFGKHLPAESIKKIGEALKGKNGYWYGKTGPNKGKHMPLKQRKKIRDSMKGKHAGEKNHMFGEHSWNKDLTKETDAIVRRISEANRGKHLSAEAKKKIGNANRGKKRLDVRERNLKNNPMHSIEARVKSKKTHKELYLNKKNHPRYGLIHSDETKDKISASQKRFYATPAGEKNKEKLSLIHQGHNRSPKTEFKAGLHASPKTEFKKGHIPWILGKKGLIIGYKFPKGEKNPNWNNGSSFEPYSPEFNNILKRQINERDNFTCQNPNCDHACAKLCVHHIDYVKENCDQSNLITLCISCNTKANYDRPFWKALYSRIVQDRIKETKLQIQLVEIK